MKIVVGGGTGSIGRRVVSILAAEGHLVIAAAPSGGVDTISGRGLASALSHADVVIDVTNAPSDGRMSPMRFLESSTRNLLSAGANAGVGHHVVLSIVGVDAMSSSEYYAAKLAQEHLVEGSQLQFTIIRSTQFFDFADIYISSLSDPEHVRLPPVMMQPMAPAEVVAILSHVALGSPLNRTVEVAGPDTMTLVEMVNRRLKARGNNRIVVADTSVHFFGLAYSDVHLMPRQPLHIGSTHFSDWLSEQPVKLAPRTPRTGSNNGKGHRHRRRLLQMQERSKRDRCMVSATPRPHA